MSITIPALSMVEAYQVAYLVQHGWRMYPWDHSSCSWYKDGVSIKRKSYDGHETEDTEFSLDEAYDLQESLTKNT
jgi:hypothetical protein